MDIRRKSLDDATLLAPFDGTVSATYVENFSNVRAKEAVIRLLDTSQIEFTIQMPESLIGNRPYVHSIRVRFDALPGVEVPARIKEVGTEASSTTRTYPITLIMDPPKGVALLPGMAGEASGKLDLPEDVAQAGFEVPSAAVFTADETDGQQSFVWVIDREAMTVSRRGVDAVGFSGRGTLVQGVAPGEWIAIAGVSYLQEGQQVRILE